MITKRISNRATSPQQMEILTRLMPWLLKYVLKCAAFISSPDIWVSCFIYSNFFCGWTGVWWRVIQATTKTPTPTKWSTTTLSIATTTTTVWITPASTNMAPLVNILLLAFLRKLYNNIRRSSNSPTPLRPAFYLRNDLPNGDDDLDRRERDELRDEPPKWSNNPSKEI